MEIYQWLFMKNGFKVSKVGYFVYCNGRKDEKAFDGKLEFDVTILSYEGKTSWVEPAILDIYHCLKSDTIPRASEDCEYCNYRRKVAEEAKKFLGKD